MSKKLVINALLAGFWAGLAAWQAGGQEFNKAAALAVGAVVVRACIGFVASQLGKPVPVDA